MCLGQGISTKQYIRRPGSSVDVDGMISAALGVRDVPVGVQEHQRGTARGCREDVHSHLSAVAHRATNHCWFHRRNIRFSSERQPVDQASDLFQLGARSSPVRREWDQP